MSLIKLYKEGLDVTREMLKKIMQGQECLTEFTRALLVVGGYTGDISKITMDDLDKILELDIFEPNSEVVGELIHCYMDEIDSLLSDDGNILYDDDHNRLILTLSIWLKPEILYDLIVEWPRLLCFYEKTIPFDVLKRLIVAENFNEYSRHEINNTTCNEKTVIMRQIALLKDSEIAELLNHYAKHRKYLIRLWALITMFIGIDRAKHISENYKLDKKVTEYIKKFY